MKAGGAYPVLPVLVPACVAAMVIAFSFLSISNKLENVRTELDVKRTAIC